MLADKQLIALTIVSVAILPTKVAEAQKLYWSETGPNKVWRANLDGSDAENLFSDRLNNPHGIAVDSRDGRVYWSDQSFLFSADSSGDDIRLVFQAPNSNEQWSDLEIDEISDRVFFLNQDNLVGQVGLDGTNYQLTGITANGDFSLDALASQVYVANTAIIERWDMDGSNLHVILTDLHFAGDLQVVPEYGYVFFQDNYRIYRVDLQTGEVVVVVDLAGASTVRLAIDPVDMKLYWWSKASSSNSRISRCDFDGANADYFVTGGDGTARRLVFDSIRRKLYWTSDINQIYQWDISGGVTSILLLDQIFQHNVPTAIKLLPNEGKMLLYNSNWFYPYSLDGTPLGNGVSTTIPDGVFDPVERKIYGSPPN